jgi:ribonuclease HII
MIVLGVDEVGRGCIAGPLVVGAVVLEGNIAGIKDSKLLSRSKREQLAKIIYLTAKYCGLGWVNASEINTIGLSKSLSLAAARSLERLNINFDRAVIDGNINYLPNYINAEILVHGDNIEPAISAASIIAKVARDRYMASLSTNFNGYGFEKHVGYCTKEHIEALLKFGITAQHRLTFAPVKFMLGSVPTYKIQQ